jgi:glyoxylase-like metal-dependent hydrolase (beta-lactamase superfamily II)
VWRILGRNPSAFTLTGTNIYLVGTGSRRILIDTGEARPGVLQDLLSVMRQEECVAIDQIVITHWHHDHLTGLKEVLAGLGPVPVRMYLPSEGSARNGRNIYGELGGSFDPHEYLQDMEVAGLEDGEVLGCEGATLQVMHTPGHTNDHVCLALEEERALFTGDNVLGWGTGTFQDLQQYMRSLQKMRDARPELLYPAHGPLVGDGGAGACIDMYISHREERIQQVVQVLREAQPSGLTPEEVARQVYKDRPDVLGTAALFGGACNNTRLVLEYLQKEGQCNEDGSYYSLCVPSRL